MPIGRRVTISRLGPEARRRPRRRSVRFAVASAVLAGSIVATSSPASAVDVSQAEGRFLSGSAAGIDLDTSRSTARLR